MASLLITRCPLCGEEKLIRRQTGPCCYGGCSLNRQEELIHECDLRGIRAPEPGEPLSPAARTAAFGQRRGRGKFLPGQKSESHNLSSHKTRPAPAIRRDVDDVEPGSAWGSEPPL